MRKDIKNRIRKLGFISIELVIIGSIVLAGGFIGVDKLMKNSAKVMNNFEISANDTRCMQNNKKCINGKLANGIFSGTLYINGDSYKNIWKPNNNIGIFSHWAGNFIINEDGYSFVPQYEDIYIGLAASENGNVYNEVLGQKFLIDKNKKYIIYTNSNHTYINLHIDNSHVSKIIPLWDQEGYFEIKDTKENETFFTIRIGRHDATIGENCNLFIKIYEVPLDLDVDIEKLTEPA